MKAHIGIGMLVVLLAALVASIPAGAQQPTAPAGKDAPTKAAPKGGKTVKQSAVITMEKGGEIAIEFFPDDAPKTVENFVTLAKKGFYNGVTFHRVEPGFVVQGGDPKGNGTGGPGYTFEDEFNQHKVVRGALAMANAGPNTNGSQFFIVTTRAAEWLDGKHTVFGQVVSGMETVDAIEASDTDGRDAPIEPKMIERIEIVE